jgi:hypothetical protein
MAAPPVGAQPVVCSLSSFAARSSLSPTYISTPEVVVSTRVIEFPHQQILVRAPLCLKRSGAVGSRKNALERSGVLQTEGAPPGIC